MRYPTRLPITCRSCGATSYFVEFESDCEPSDFPSSSHVSCEHCGIEVKTPKPIAQLCIARTAMNVAIARSAEHASNSKRGLVITPEHQDFAETFAKFKAANDKKLRELEDKVSQSKTGEST